MKLNNNIIIYLMWLIGCWGEEEIVLIKYINLVFFFFFFLPTYWFLVITISEIDRQARWQIQRMELRIVWI
jgi:hypothetical protein